MEEVLYSMRKDTTRKNIFYKIKILFATIRQFTTAIRAIKTTIRERSLARLFVLGVPL